MVMPWEGADVFVFVGWVPEFNRQVGGAGREECAASGSAIIDV